MPRIRAAMERYLDDPRVEALAFDYLHFYGNANTYAWSPRWYRTEARILRNTIPAWGPEGMFFVVLETHKRGRYPRAAHTGATIYHYGWLKSMSQRTAKRDQNVRFWGAPREFVDSADIDPEVLKPFTGTHPKVIQDWLPPAEGLFQANPEPQADLAGTEAPPDAAPGEVVRPAVPQEALQAGCLIRRACR